MSSTVKSTPKILRAGATLAAREINSNRFEDAGNKSSLQFFILPFLASNRVYSKENLEVFSRQRVCREV